MEKRSDRSNGLDAALYKNISVHLHFYHYCIVQVKKVLAQTVIAMAHHTYLEMEGGHLYIEFVVRQCALPPDPQVCNVTYVVLLLTSTSVGSPCTKAFRR